MLGVVPYRLPARALASERRRTGAALGVHELLDLDTLKQLRTFFYDEARARARARAREGVGRERERARARARERESA